MAASSEPLPHVAASSIAEQLDVIIGTILTLQASRAFAQELAPKATACAGGFLSDDAKPGSVVAARSKGGMADDFATEETDDPLYADDRNFYKVELWTKDRQHVLRLLYAGNNFDRAKGELAAYAKKRPRARLTVRQRNRVLEEWPRTGGSSPKS